MKNRSTIQTLTFVQINPEHLYMKLNMKLVHAIIHSFGLKKLAPCKNFTRILNWLLTFKTGTWRFFWLLLFVSQSSPNCCKSNYYTKTTDPNLYSVFIFGRKEKWPGKTGDRLFQSVMINLLLLPKETIWKKWWFVVLQLFCHNIHLIRHSMIW